MTITQHPRGGTAGRCSRRSLWVVLGLVVLVVGLQTLASTRPRPRPLPVPSGPVVVVGVPELSSRSAGDQQLPWALGRPVSAAAVSEPGTGPEPAAGTAGCVLDVWASLGAGRTTSVGRVCSAAVAGHQVTGWAQLRAESAAVRPDARLGTLAAGVPGCVQAVGPGAAVAAASPDGTVRSSATLNEFLDARGATTCALTLVDLGPAPLSALVPLLRRPDTTVVLLGLRGEASRQAVETLDWVGSAPPGWLTSASTRRPGVVTVPDLTRTLVAAAGGGGSGSSLPVDGALLEVAPARVSSAAVQRQVHALQGQPHTLATAAAVLGGLLVVGCVSLVVARRRGRRRVTGTLLAMALALPTALALTGALPWQRAPAGGGVLVALTLVAELVLTVLVRRGAQLLALPTALVASGATVLVLSADAATGGLLQRGSMLNPHPLDGGRWYGFGNVTFAVYAWAVLVVVGGLAGQVPRTAAWVLATLALACEASPTMGADLGGVVALAPPLLWLLLHRRGRPVGVLRGVVLAAAGVGLGAVAAGLDWLRGPQRRTHLGGFIQQLVDGSAGVVVVRKAGAVLTGAVSPPGLLALGLAVVSWSFVVRSTRRGAPVFPWLPAVVAATGASAVLGTLVNDSGVLVGAVLSVLLAVTVASLAQQDGEDREAGRADGEQPPSEHVGRPVVAEVDPRQADRHREDDAARHEPTAHPARGGHAVRRDEQEGAEQPHDAAVRGVAGRERQVRGGPAEQGPGVGSAPAHDDLEDVDQS